MILPLLASLRWSNGRQPFIGYRMNGNGIQFGHDEISGGRFPLQRSTLPLLTIFIFFLFLININFFFFIFFFHPIHSLPLLIYFHVPRFSKKNLRSGKSSGVNQMVKRRPACPHFFPVWICKYPSEMLKSNLIVGPLPPPTTFFFHLSLSLSLSVFRSTWGSKSNHTAVAFSVLSRERRKERWGRGRGGINRDRTGRRIKNKQETAIDE